MFKIPKNLGYENFHNSEDFDIMVSDNLAKSVTVPHPFF